MYSFSYLEPVCCSMSSSNCCFLTCIQVSQEAGQVVWYSHLFQNFPQFIVIHTVKGFGIVNKAEIDVFPEVSCFFDDPADVGNLISSSSAFSKSSLNIWKFTVHVLLKPGLANFEHYFASAVHHARVAGGAAVAGESYLHLAAVVGVDDPDAVGQARVVSEAVATAAVDQQRPAIWNLEGQAGAECLRRG